MNQTAKAQITVTGAIAQSLGAYRHLFHLVTTLAACMAFIAAFITLQSESFDMVEVIMYFAMSILFVCCLGLSVILDSSTVTHVSAVIASVGGGGFTCLLLINSLFGINSELLANGSLPYTIAWLPVAIIATFIYLPPKYALICTLTGNTLVAIGGLFYAGQHWDSTTNAAIVFFLGQILLVNNLGIALLMLHSVVQHRASDIMNHSLKIMHEAEQEAFHIRHIDPLTGLNNASGIQNELQATMDAAVRERQRTSILAMKLDHQSETHEQLGEIEFQNLMKQVASNLQRVMPDSAGIGRYEGSLFMLWMKGMDAEGIKEVAKQAHQSLLTVDEDLDLSKEVIWSVGGVSTNGIRDARYLVDQVLHELYRARHQNGEDKICIADFGLSRS